MCLTTLVFQKIMVSSSLWSASPQKKLSTSAGSGSSVPIKLLLAGAVDSPVAIFSLLPPCSTHQQESCLA
jgi:hypothetical protein